MQILLGDSSSKKVRQICQKHGFGRMLAQNWPDLYPQEPWAFDNGAWGFFKRGIDFDEATFLVRLNRAMGISWEPYFAVLPDMVGGGDKSLELSMSWIGNLPKWKWYLAVQDGMSVAKVIDNIGYVDGIFLGGTDHYKRYGGYWCQLAHHFGKKFHFGRAGTLNKLAYAMMIGVDSLDSAFPLWTKDRLFSFIQAISQLHMPLSIFSPHPEHGEGALVQLTHAND